MKKNGDANNNPIVMIVLGAIFSVAGIVCLIMLAKEFNPLFALVGAVLAVCGVAFLVFGILRGKTLKAYKNLLNDPNALVTDAQFIKATVSSYKSRSIGVGGIDVPTSINIYKKITYSYVDEKGVKQTVKSVLSYTPNQADFLQNKGTFKIKCKGDFSAIIEELPEQNKRFNV